MLRLWHCQSDAITTRLDLIHHRRQKTSHRNHNSWSLKYVKYLFHKFLRIFRLYLTYSAYFKVFGEEGLNFSIFFSVYIFMVIHNHVTVQYMYSICTLFKIIVGATRPKHNIIVGATWHSQHLLLFAANTIIFCLTSGKINNCSYSTRWQPIKMTKKHPAPPPQLTYNG